MIFDILKVLPTGTLVRRLLFRHVLLLDKDADHDLVSKHEKKLPRNFVASYYGLSDEVMAWMRENRVPFLFEGYWERIDPEAERKRFRLHFMRERDRILFKMRWM